jgi:hypothetical protein
MPNYQGVWSLSTQFQNASGWKADNPVPMSGDIALFAGGEENGGLEVNTIQYITITSSGNGTDFGDLSQGRMAIGTVSSSTKGVFGGGKEDVAGLVDTIEYVTISTLGNATNFGSLSNARQWTSGVSSSTRGVFMGGFDSGGDTNVIEYITIATTGNATDFGDTTVSRYGGANGNINSTTRGILAGGQNSSGSQNVIDYITIATTGNATDFGDILSNRAYAAGTSSSTRGIIAGGRDFGAGLTQDGVNTNVIQYITIASTGNATDFGDLNQATRRFSGTSNSTTGVFGGGKFYNGSSDSFVFDLQSITIASTGNASDFGDLIGTGTEGIAALSNSHGGLS